MSYLLYYTLNNQAFPYNTIAVLLYFLSLKPLVSQEQNGDNIVRKKQNISFPATDKEVSVMKIYNIKDTKAFFNRLTRCKGDVEIVNKQGMHLSLVDNNHKQLDTVAASYADGKINEIELFFLKPEDAVMMLQYLASM